MSKISSHLRFDGSKKELRARTVMAKVAIGLVVTSLSFTGCSSTPDRYPTASSPQINRPPTGKQSYPRISIVHLNRQQLSTTGKQSYPRISIEGNTEFIVSTGPDGKVASISARDQEIGITGLGLGGYADCPGTHVLHLELAHGEGYGVRGVLFVGIRTDSPRFYDLGFVVLTSADKIPEKALKERARLLSLGTDSLFARPDFQFSKTLVWFGKVERLPDGTDRIIGW